MAKRDRVEAYRHHHGRKGDVATAAIETLESRVLLSGVSFAALQTSVPALGGRWVTVGDFNGDSKDDLAMGNGDGYGLVSILLGNGDGTFGNRSDYHAGSWLESVTMADFNGDGKIDLAAMGGHDDGTVSVLLGNGDGTFASANDYSVGSYPYSITVGDFDGDGSSDLAVASAGSTVSILLGNGDGTFADRSDHSVMSVSSITMGDFNGDGKIDLATASSRLVEITSLGMVGILLGNGDGTFTSGNSYMVSGGVSSIAVGDFDGNGYSDLAATCGGGEVSVLLGNGDGTFASGNDYSVGGSPGCVTLDDFNGDGKCDLATVNRGGDSASILLGNGDGTFAGKTDFGVGKEPMSMASGDFNGDGRRDLAAPDVDNGTVRVLLNITGPSSLLLSDRSVVEHQPIGAMVGTLSSTDPDGETTFTYSLVTGAGSDDNASFTIDGDQLLAAASFNYEMKSSYSIRIRTTNSAGEYLEKVFTINVTDVEEPAISIPDANLEAAIRDALWKPSGDITEADMERLTSLRASAKGISDLSGLEYARNLTTLFLSDNEISNLSPLTGLTGLTRLELSGNRISDVSPLSDLTGLTTLLLLFNQINNLSPLAGMKGMDTLGLSHNRIRDLSPLAGMRALKWLILSDNWISDLSPLAGLTELTTLELDNDHISGVSPLAGMTGMRVLCLSFNEIGDLSPLAGMKGLVELRLSGNQISDLSPLAGMTGLRRLDLSDNQISNLSSLTGMKGIIELGLGYNQISNLSPLAGMKGMDTLGLSNNRIRDLSPLARLTGIGCLYVYDNNLDTSPDSATMEVCRTLKRAGVDLWYAPQYVAPDMSLSANSVAENCPSGVAVGTLITASTDVNDVFTYSLVSGTSAKGSDPFVISGNQLVTNAIFDCDTKSRYSIRVRSTDRSGRHVDKVFTIRIMPEPSTFGTKHALILSDADGDTAKFSISGTGRGTRLPDGTLALTGTTAKTVLTVTVRRGATGDGAFHLSGITADGLLNGIDASAVVVSGRVYLNTLDQAPGKAKVSLKFRQISGADVRVQGMPVQTIAVDGAVTDSRISTTGSIEKFEAVALLDSDILVGVETSSAGQFAERSGDFIDSTARLGNLKVTGEKLFKGSSYPAYVSGVHLSAPSVGVLRLTNVAVTDGEAAIQANVLRDTGTLTTVVRDPVMEGVTVVDAGVWKQGAAGRPGIFSVL